MGNNLELGCLTRQNTTSINDRPTQSKKIYASEQQRLSFLLPININETINYAKILGIKQYNPYSKYLTNKIIQLSKLNQELDLTLCRFLLLIYNENYTKINTILIDNKQYKQLIQPIQDDKIKNYIEIIGIDFYQSLIINIKINENVNYEAIQQYFLYFFEYLFYEIAQNNKLSNSIQIVYDLQKEIINTKLLNFFVNLTFQHYFLNIKKIILININLNKISSEVIGLLNTPKFKFLVLPLSDISYLTRYIKKSQLNIEYGGTYSKKRMSIPISLKEAQQYKL